MPKQSPFLYRRGDVLAFRIAVPLALRPSVGCRELTKSLRTSDKYLALPLALELAANAKRLFYDLRKIMSDSPSDDALTIQKLKLQLKMRIELSKVVNRETIVQTELLINLALQKHKSELFDERREHDRHWYAQSRAHPPAAQEGPSDSAPAKSKTSAPKLSFVIKSFLDGYKKNNHTAMLKKHESALPMLLTVIGDKPIDEIKQLDIKSFFVLIESLPPRWSDECRKRKISIQELAKIKHPITIAPKTFKSTYLASIRSFLISARTDFQDQGFPTTLVTSGISYHGTREAGENSQRHFKPTELAQLFGSSEMKLFANDKSKSHHYWLPLIGLYTGARVNEICQINPQTDILKEPETDIWYFWITETTDGDERITKSTKNEVSRRKVPIHSALINRGILRYIDTIKQQGSKLLLPAFKPSRGKASGEAEKWFRQHLKDMKLRNETPGEKILGMHAFRSTFSNAAMNAGVDESSIVGHTHNINDDSSNGFASNSTTVKRKYRGELSLENKQKIIEKVEFDSVPLIASN